MNKEIKTRDGTVFFVMNCMNEEEYRKKKNEDKVHRITLGLLYVVFGIVVLMTYCAFPELLQYKKMDHFNKCGNDMLSWLCHGKMIWSFLFIIAFIIILVLCIRKENIIVDSLQTWINTYRLNRTIYKTIVDADEGTVSIQFSRVLDRENAVINISAPGKIISVFDHTFQMEGSHSCCLTCFNDKIGYQYKKKED